MYQYHFFYKQSDTGTFIFGTRHFRFLIRYLTFIAFKMF